MSTSWLIAASVFLPLVWGWAMHWLLARVWPLKRSQATITPADKRGAVSPIDYQI
jgi:hypothetical protein